MAKPEWGMKRICPSCATKYYDLRRHPPVCPSCGTVYDPEALLRSRRTRVAVEEPRPVRAVAAVVAAAEVPDFEDVAEEEGITEERESDEDTVIEDVDDLGDDEEIAPLADEGEEDR